MQDTLKNFKSPESKLSTNISGTPHSRLTKTSMINQTLVLKDSSLSSTKYGNMSKVSKYETTMGHDNSMAGTPALGSIPEISIWDMAPRDQMHILTNMTPIERALMTEKA